MMMISDGNSTLSSFVIFLNSRECVCVCVYFYNVGKRTIDDLYCIIRGDFSFSFSNMWTTAMIENWHHTHTHTHTLTHASNDDVRMMVAEHANRLPIDILTLLGSRCVVDVVTLKAEKTKKRFYGHKSDLGAAIKTPSLSLSHAVSVSFLLYISRFAVFPLQYHHNYLFFFDVALLCLVRCVSIQACETEHSLSTFNLI